MNNNRILDFLFNFSSFFYKLKESKIPYLKKELSFPFKSIKFYFKAFLIKGYLYSASKKINDNIENIIEIEENIKNDPSKSKDISFIRRHDFLLGTYKSIQKDNDLMLERYDNFFKENEDYCSIYKIINLKKEIEYGHEKLKNSTLAIIERISLIPITNNESKNND